MNNAQYSRNYDSSAGSAALFPSLVFYLKMASILWRAGRKANRGEYSGMDWAFSSTEVGQAMESVGSEIHIEGFENVLNLQTPCVFVANHMSTLETFFLPCIIQPVRDVTFVVKDVLLKYPCLGPVLKSRDPLVVSRQNAREDLAVVLDGGKKHLDNGRSVIVFPQGTRRPTVKAEEFSSLGVKLARKAKVPVMPVALKSDAWGTGIIKDIGWIKPQKPIRFLFGPALSIEGNGKEEHSRTVEFIKEHVEQWQAQDK